MRNPIELDTAAARIAIASSVAIAGYFLAVDAADYLRQMSVEVYGRFWKVRYGMFVHIAAGALALVLGTIQVCLGFWRRTSTAHRWIGRVYVAMVFVSCLAAGGVLRNGSVVGPWWVALLLVLAASALLFTSVGLIEARRRRWTRHTAWMLRSYMAMMVFAWFRLVWELPFLNNLAAGARAASVLALTMATSLAVTEWIVRRRSVTDRSPPSFEAQHSEGAKNC